MGGFIMKKLILVIILIITVAGNLSNNSNFAKAEDNIPFPSLVQSSNLK